MGWCFWPLNASRLSPDQRMAAVTQTDAPSAHCFHGTTCSGQTLTNLTSIYIYKSMYHSQRKFRAEWMRARKLPARGTLQAQNLPEMLCASVEHGLCVELLRAVWRKLNVA